MPKIQLTNFDVTVDAIQTALDRIRTLLARGVDGENIHTELDGTIPEIPASTISDMPTPLKPVKSDKFFAVPIEQCDTKLNRFKEATINNREYSVLSHEELLAINPDRGFVSKNDSDIVSFTRRIVITKPVNYRMIRHEPDTARTLAWGNGGWLDVSFVGLPSTSQYDFDFFYNGRRTDGIFETRVDFVSETANEIAFDVRTNISNIDGDKEFITLWIKARVFCEVLK